MRNFSCFIAFFLIGKTVFAQSDSSFLPKKDSSKVIISFDTKFESNSNTIPNSMLAKLLWGGLMSKQFLTETTDDLKNSHNRFGFEFKNSASVVWKGKKCDWEAGVKYRELLGLRFSKDLFGLAFLGNTSYDGRTANLSNTKFKYIQYTGASFGIKNAIRKDKLGNLYTGLTVLYGLNYQSLRTGQASIYTAPDARFIQTEGDLKLQYQAPNPGFGLGIDVRYSFESKRNAFYLAVEDLGFMNWQKVTTFEGTSQYTYQGEEIANITNYTGDSLFSDFSVRGFANRFGIKESQKNVTTLLPFSITARYQRELNKSWKLMNELYFIDISAYLPRGSVKAEKTFTNNWKLNAGLAYGGFGRGNMLLGCAKTFAHNWTFSLDSYFLGMAFLPKYSHGIGLNFGLKKGF